MLIVDGAGIITLANSRVEAIFGYPPGGLLNRSVDILEPETMRVGHPEKRESFANETLPRAMADQRQLEGRRFDGSAVPIEIMLNPVKTTSGRVVVASVIEITERIHAQEQLRLTASEIANKIS
jgi:PAS domain S-box-containing protein